MNKHAFLTGATGFLGVNLVHQLLDDGWKITAIHRSPIKHPALINAPINWKKGTLDDVDSLRKALPTEPFVAFHMAANTAQWKPAYKVQTQTNVGGTANLLQAIDGSQIQRFIHTSSISAFGLQEGTINEESESHAIDNKHNYSITKWQGEQLIKNQVAENGLNAVILNPCHIVGPWDTNNWIQLFTHVKNETVPGVPPAGGNFAWVGEVAKSHISALSNGVKGENYILAGPFVSMLQFINEIEKQLDKKISKKTISPFLLKAIEPLYRVKGLITRKEPTLTPDKVTLLLKSYVADDSKAQRVLGHKHIPISEIVARTLEWMKTQ